MEGETALIFCLPRDVILVTMRYLTIDEACSLFRTCKKMQVMGNHDALQAYILSRVYEAVFGVVLGTQVYDDDRRFGQMHITNLLSTTLYLYRVVMGCAGFHEPGGNAHAWVIETNMHMNNAGKVYSRENSKDIVQWKSKRKRKRKRKRKNSSSNDNSYMKTFLQNYNNVFSKQERRESLSIGIDKIWEEMTRDTRSAPDVALRSHRTMCTCGASDFRDTRGHHIMSCGPFTNVFEVLRFRWLILNMHAFLAYLEKTYASGTPWINEGTIMLCLMDNEGSSFSWPPVQQQGIYTQQEIRNLLASTNGRTCMKEIQKEFLASFVASLH